MNRLCGQEALADSVECIRISPTFVKGYHRKALAHVALNDHTSAYRTYEEIFCFDSESGAGWRGDGGTGGLLNKMRSIS
jgi:hypothetical protein